MFLPGLLLSILGAILWLAVRPPSERVIDLPTVGAILTLAGILLMAIGVRLAWPAGARRRRPRDELRDPIGPAYHDWAGLRMPDRTATRQPIEQQSAEIDRTQVLPVVRDDR